jgi:hypothetical protein
LVRQLITRKGEIQPLPNFLQFFEGAQLADFGEFLLAGPVAHGGIQFVLRKTAPAELFDNLIPESPEVYLLTRHLLQHCADPLPEQYNGTPRWFRDWATSPGRQYGRQPKAKRFK